MKIWIDEMDLDFGYLIQYSMSAIIHLLFFTSSFSYCRDTPPKMNLHRTKRFKLHLVSPIDEIESVVLRLKIMIDWMGQQDK